MTTKRLRSKSFNSKILTRKVNASRILSNQTSSFTSVASVVAGSSDPYYLNTYLLLKGNGSDGSTSFIDSGPNNLSITASGGPTISTAQSKFGGSSILFNGTNSLASPTSAVIGTGDYTMEAWVYLINSSTVYRTLFGLGSSHFRYGDAGFGGRLQVGTNLDTLDACWSCTATHGTYVNTWVHVAFSRQSGTCRLFLNGVVQNINNGANPGSFPYTSFTSTQNLGTVAAYAGGSSWIGYQDDVRFTVGVARYTSNFTPTEL
jgi:hypothetical protein